MRFGQRIGALHLNWVLRSQHKKGLLQPIGRLGDRDLALLHRFQQRRLGLGRSPVYLVGQNDVGKDRPRFESKKALVRIVYGNHRRAYDVGGHEVRRELDAAETALDNLRQRTDQQRLAQPGCPLQ